MWVGMAHDWLFSESAFAIIEPFCVMQCWYVTWKSGGRSVSSSQTRHVTLQRAVRHQANIYVQKKKLTNAGTCGTTCQFYGSPFASFIIYCLLLDVLICSKLCWHSVMSVLRMYFQHFHWLTTLKSCDYKQFQNIPYDVYKMCYVGCRYIWNISNIYCNIDKISKINKIYIYLFLFIYFVKTQQKHNYN